MTLETSTVTLAAAAPVPRPAVAIGLVLVAMCGFAVMDGIGKVLSQTIPIPEILWVRSIVFCVMAASLLGARQQPWRVLARSRQPWLQGIRGLLLVGEGTVFMLAFRRLPVGDVHAIAAMAPLIVVALSVPVLGERVGMRRWAAVLAGFVGMLLIVRPGIARIDPAMLLALLAATLWAVYQVLVRLCARTDASETTSLWTAGTGLLATSILGPAVWVWPDAHEWLLLAIIAVLGGIAHMTLIGALGLTQPSLLQPFNYTMFVWAVIVGYVGFGAVPDAWTLAGAAVIIASGIYAWSRGLGPAHIEPGG